MPRDSKSIIEHAEDLARRFELAEPSPLGADGQQAVDELRVAVVDRGRSEARIAAAVSAARAAGVSWAVLAAVLGTSRQAAQQRYGDR